MASYAQRAKKILEAAGLAPKKSWGQNFLTDDHVLTRIAQASGAAPGGTVLELGAGLGALTLAVMERGVHVVAVERDRELVPLLAKLSGRAPSDTVPAGTLTVLETDAARLDYAELARTYGAPLHILGNLPYQLSGRILVNLSEAAPVIADAVVLVQREVAERLAALPGTRIYGLLSVLVGRAFDAQLIKHVPPGAFLPPPKVHSAVVRLVRRTAFAAALEGDALAHAQTQAARYARVAKAAFGVRRKTLRNALSRGLALDKARTEALLEAACVDPDARAETLAIDDFERLATALGALPEA